jgi:hypothetical protein
MVGGGGGEGYVSEVRNNYIGVSPPGTEECTDCTEVR